MNNYEEYYRQLALNISHYRKLRGLTQIQFAEKVGLSRTYISNIEAPNVHKSFSIKTLFLIADALDVELAALFAFKK